MDIHSQKSIAGFLFTLLVLNNPSVHAAKAINLRYPTGFLLQSFIPLGEIKNRNKILHSANNDIAIKEINRTVDSKRMMHIRLQQTYRGYEVIGADAVMHIQADANISGPLTQLDANNRGRSMNGFFYQDLQADLDKVSPNLFTEAQAQKALQQGIWHYQQNVGYPAEITQKISKLMIYVGENNKARWVYRVNFHIESTDKNQTPAEPVYLLDAESFDVIASWDDITTLAIASVEAGGLGGNIKTGYRIYDGLSGHFSSLTVNRDDSTNTCFLQNHEITIRDFNTKKILSFSCLTKDVNHNNLYWNAAFDSVNQGYSPGNDAFFGAVMVSKMYSDWYGVPVLSDANGNAIMLNLYVHKKNYDDAYWDPVRQIMVFGDGFTRFYPLTAVDIAAHELSHGFTSQHARLFMSGQSGAMNESFSDMAAQAAEVYAYGPLNNSWKIAGGILKKSNEALRYLDKPSKDCAGRVPGYGCSVNDASQYKAGLDPHYASGVYNRFFYTLATTSGWDVRKAFEVIVHANRYYWTAASTFNEGACNVMSAANQLGYDVNDVKKAFDVVKVNYKQFC